MTRIEYKNIENHMLHHMKDSSHDHLHIYRVLNSSLDIAESVPNVELDILIAACLLHDIGREQQFINPELCHAKVGGDMAFDYLTGNNWNMEKAAHVRSCISSHRFRGDNAPQSIEAKILFDADKLDVSGAMGIARTLMYRGQVAEPLYVFSGENIVTDGGGADISSFFQEYNYKLTKVYEGFYTGRARKLALERKEAATLFYNALYNEVTRNHQHGSGILNKVLDGE